MGSHIPTSSYGTYVTLAPKVLVFPIFVQVSFRRLVPGKLLLSEMGVSLWPSCPRSGLTCLQPPVALLDL